MAWDNVEEMFKDLDRREFSFFSEALWSYFKALMNQGFTRREAFRLIESYSRFIYDMALEEFMAERHATDPGDDDVDTLEEDEV